MGRCGRTGVYVIDTYSTSTERRRTNPCAIAGTPGRDTMRGTPWADVLFAGRGNDVVLVRGGGRDVVRCGLGRDRVVADRRDRVARDCERVERA